MIYKPLFDAIIQGLFQAYSSTDLCSLIYKCAVKKFSIVHSKMSDLR